MPVSWDDFTPVAEATDWNQFSPAEAQTDWSKFVPSKEQPFNPDPSISANDLLGKGLGSAGSLPEISTQDDPRNIHRQILADEMARVRSESPTVFGSAEPMQRQTLGMATLENSVGDLLKGISTAAAGALAAGFPGTTPETKRRLIEEHPLYKAGKFLQESGVFKTAAEQIPDYAKMDAVVKAQDQAIPMAPLVLAGELAPVVIGLQSAGAHIDNDYKNAIAKGKSSDEAAVEAFDKSVISGGMQALVFAALPGPLRKLGDKYLIDKLGTDGLKRIIAGQAAQVGEGAVLGAASRIGENAVEGKPLAEGTGPAAVGMAIMQGIMPRGATEQENLKERYQIAADQVDYLTRISKDAFRKVVTDNGKEKVQEGLQGPVLEPAVEPKVGEVTNPNLTSKQEPVKVAEVKAEPKSEPIPESVTDAGLNETMTDEPGPVDALLQSKPTPTPEPVKPQGEFKISEQVELNELRITKESRGLGRLNSERLAELESKEKSGTLDQPVKPQGMGGAVPEEFADSGSYASNMFAAIDRDRIEMGKEPMDLGKKRTWDEDSQKALHKMNREPNWLPELLADISANPRPLLSWENAGLVWYRANLKAEAHNAMKRISLAAEDGRVDALNDAKADVAKFEAQIMVLDDAVGRGGTGSEAGRSLKAQQMATGQDFSLVEMRLEKRAIANNGKPLTPAQEADVARLYKEIAEKDAALKKYEDEASQRNADETLDNIQGEHEQTYKSPYSKAVLDHAKKVVADHKKITSQEQRSKVIDYFSNDDNFQGMGAAVPGEFGTRPLPKEILDAVAIEWGQKTMEGLTDRKAFDADVLSELGDRSKPYLDQIWEAANKHVDEYLASLTVKLGKNADQVKRVVKKTDSKEVISDLSDKIKSRVENNKRKEITGYVQKLARQFVEDGITDREVLLDKVHEVLKGIDPEFTRREAMDAISGYGQFKRLSKDEISVKLRDLKGQMQQMAKLDDMLKKQPPLKTGIERREISNEESKLIKKVNAAKNEFQIPSTDSATQLQSALDTIKARAERQRQDYVDRLERKDFATGREKRIIKRDPEAELLEYHAYAAKEAWHKAMMEDRLANASPLMKAIRFTGDVLNTQRAILTSMDLSAVLRQGGFIATVHPIRALQSFPAMFRAFGSEAAAHAINVGIARRPNFHLYKSSKLYLSEKGHKLSQMEEAYMSRMLDKLPTALGGGLVRGSERAYTTFLNKLRADSFDSMIATLARSREVTPKEANAIANYINVSTGRGTFGVKHDAALATLATVFFAPRYTVSRFQMLFGQPMVRGTLRTRAMIAGEYARFLIGVGLVYGMGKKAGATIETDARSSEFGKMRWGNTRIDPLAGLLQTTVLLGREISGQTKQSNSGRIVPIRGPGVPYKGTTGFDVLARFSRQKLAPVPGAVINSLSGTDTVGQPVTIANTAMGSLVPLSLQDIYKVMNEHGVPAGTAFTLLSIFGMGLQNFDASKHPRPERAF